MNNYFRFSLFLSLMVCNAYAPAIPIITIKTYAQEQHNNPSLFHSIKSQITHTNQINPLTYFTTQQLENHFKNAGYSPQQILNRLDLYSSDEFIKFIKTYPEYEDTIIALHKKFNNLSNFKKVIYRLIGGYSSRLQKRINSLYEEIEEQKQKDNNAHSSRKENSILLSSDRLNEYQSLENVYKSYSPLLAKAIEKRCNAKSADELQKVLDTENYDIKNRTLALQSYSPLYDHKEALLDCANAVTLYNNAGNTEKAMNIADLCWTLLDYGQV